MRLRNTVVGVLFTAALAAPFVGTATAADLDCADFPSQAAAQAALAADRTDPNGLDQDRDGTACENVSYAAATVGTPTAVPAPVPAQVTTRPVGGVAAGDGSLASGEPATGPGSLAADDDGGPLPYLLGGLAFTAAGGAAVAARRAARGRA